MSHLYNLSFASGWTASIILPKKTDSQAVMNVVSAVSGETCNCVGYAGTTSETPRGIVKK
jgi:hypothetical protein